MEQQEQDLWKIVDVGGYAALATLFSFTLEGIKMKVESDDTDLQELRDRIKNSFEKLSNRFEEMNLNLLDKQRFPVDTLRELKSDVFPEMGTKFKELDLLLKHFIAGASHLKLRITSKIKNCRELVKLMGELGLKFSRSNGYWEYRETKPERVYLEITPDQSKEGS